MIDRQRYQVNPNDTDPNAIRASLVSSTIEAAVLPSRERIVHYQLCFDQSTDTVFDPQFGRRDIRTMVSSDPEELMSPLEDNVARRVAQQEAIANEGLRNVVINGSNHTIALWISPAYDQDRSQGYNEARLTVGCTAPESEQFEGLRTVDFYTIPITDQTPQQLLTVANDMAVEFQLPQLDDPEKLRETVHLISNPTTTNPWQLLSKYFHLDSIWSAIKEKLPHQFMSQIRSKIEPLVIEASHKLVAARTLIERQRISADLTPQIESVVGFVIDTNQLPCAASTSSTDPITATLSNYGKIVDPTKAITDSNPGSISSFVSSSSSNGENNDSKFVKNCGACGAKIEQEIKKGYQCPHCHGVYEGC